MKGANVSNLGVQVSKAAGYGHHQAAIVALDVEHHPIGGQETGTCIPEFDVLRGLPLRMTGSAGQ